MKFTKSGFEVYEVLKFESLLSKHQNLSRKPVNVNEKFVLFWFFVRYVFAANILGKPKMIVEAHFSRIKDEKLIVYLRSILMSY